MSQWVPNAEAVQQVVQLLQMTQNCSRENHRVLYDKLKQMETHQEFAAYLCYVFVNDQSNLDFHAKQQAGLLLKNQIKRFWSNSPPNARSYIQSQIPNALAHENAQIRKYAAISIGMILFRGGLDCWPDLLESLIGVFNSDNLEAIHGSLLCLEGLCQGQQCRIEEERQGETFIDTCNFVCKDKRSGDVVTVCIKFMKQDKYREYRRLSMEVLLQLGQHRSEAFELNVQSYVETLYQIAADDSPQIRVLLCKSFIMLLNLHYTVIHPNVPEIIKFMLLCLSPDQPDDIRIASGEFWSYWAHNQHVDASILLPYLNDLAESLLNSMHFSQEELSELQAENDAHDQDDRPEQIDPSWQEKSKDGNPKFQEQEQIDNNTVRRAAARALDNLAIRYKDALLKFLLPLLEQRMNHDEWLIRESAILALGAIGVGCRDDIDQYLDSIMPFLCKRIEDEQYLIRCIACWTLSRFCDWFLRNKDDSILLVPLLEKMVNQLILDKSKRVQQAAISCVAALLEQGQARMLPYIEGITQQLNECLKRYKLKNLPFLFDCLIVLMSYFHEKIQQNPKLFTDLIDTAVRRMMCLEDDQPAVFGVLEFLSQTASYLGQQFHRWSPLIWQRCTKTCKAYLEATAIAEQHKANNQDFDFPRIENFVISVDMMSAIIEAVNGDVEEYLTQEDLFAIIEGGIMLPIPSCRRVVFGLLSVLCDPCQEAMTNGKSMLPMLEPHMEKLIPLALENLTPHNEQLFVNAAYFLGQATKRGPRLVQPFLEPLLVKFTSILGMPIPPAMQVPFGGTQIGPSYQTFCSAAFTVARIANAFEKDVATVFSQFAIEWTFHLGRCAEDEEKAYAFLVLMRQVRANPVVFLKADQDIGVSVLCNALGSWWEPPDTLLAASKDIIQQFKQAVQQNGGNWDNHMGRMDPQVVATFRERYDV